MEGKQTTLGANTGCIYAAPSGGTGGPKRLLWGPSGPRGRRAGAELQPPPVTSVTSLSSRVALDEVLHLAPEVLLRRAGREAGSAGAPQQGPAEASAPAPSSQGGGPPEACGAGSRWVPTVCTTLPGVPRARTQQRGEGTQDASFCGWERGARAHGAALRGPRGPEQTPTRSLPEPRLRARSQTRWAPAAFACFGRTCARDIYCTDVRGWEPECPPVELLWNGSGREGAAPHAPTWRGG